MIRLTVSIGTARVLLFSSHTALIKEELINSFQSAHTPNKFLAVLHICLVNIISIFNFFIVRIYCKQKKTGKINK